MLTFVTWRTICSPGKILQWMELDEVLCLWLALVFFFVQGVGGGNVRDELYFFVCACLYSREKKTCELLVIDFGHIYACNVCAFWCTCALLLSGFNEGQLHNLTRLILGYQRSFVGKRTRKTSIYDFFYLFSNNLLRKACVYLNLRQALTRFT